MRGSPVPEPTVGQRLPTDPDVDLRDRRQRWEPRRAPWATLATIAVGGGLGALARYGIQAAFPAGPGGFPWATFAINVAGCLLIGALMVLITEVWGGPRLVRAFLGVGVLGGFTTFSTYVVDVQRLVARGAAGTALAYLVGTLFTALFAVYAGVAATRAVIGWKARRS